MVRGARDPRGLGGWRRDADMRIGQVKAVRGDIVEALVHVHAALGFIPVHVDGLERGPGPVLSRQVFPPASAVKPKTRPVPLKVWICMVALLTRGACQPLQRT